MMNYCYVCGEKLEEKECFNCGVSDGIFPYCPKCGEFHFPFFNSAVSMVIFNTDYSKILLIRQYGRDINILVAGYVNKGENLETALIRELKEEVGLSPIDFRFNESKYFEKSNSLINNFIARVESEEFKLNPEVDFAKWYTVEEAKRAVYQNSLAEYFLNLAVSKTF